MPAPAVRPLKNPDIIRNFVNELPDSFTTDEAIQIGAKSFEIGIYTINFGGEIGCLKLPDAGLNHADTHHQKITTDEAIQIGAKYDFNLRKVTRLLKSLNGIKISKVCPDSSEDGPQEPAWMSVTDGCARNNIERFEETV